MDGNCCQDNLGWYLSRDAVTPATGCNFESLWASNLWASNTYLGNAAISNLSASNLGSYAFCNLIGNANASTTGLLSSTDWIRFDTGRSNYGVLTASNLSASNLGSYAFCNLIATANSSTTGLLSSTDWIRFDVGGAARSNYGVLTASNLSASNAIMASATFSNLGSSNLTVNVTGQTSFNVTNTGSTGVGINMTGSNHFGRVIVQDSNMALWYVNTASGSNYFPLVAERGGDVELAVPNFLGSNSNVGNVRLLPFGGPSGVFIGDVGLPVSIPALRAYTTGINKGLDIIASANQPAFMGFDCIATSANRWTDIGMWGPTGEFFCNVGGTWRIIINATTGVTNLSGVGANTTASAANVNITAGGEMRRSTSSLKYKTNIRYEGAPNYNILDLKPCYFDSKHNESERNIYGLIAEDVDNHGVHELVVRDENGEPDSLAYDRVGVMLIPVIRELRRVLQQQRQHIEDLQQRVLFLEA
jgi:hypothetical protein